MRSFSHPKLFLLVTEIVLIALGVSSCAKTESWTWERDYYTYQKGARINGVEYHEKYDWGAAQLVFGGKTYCGFNLEGKNDFVKIYEHMSALYDDWWAGPNGKDVYTIEFLVYADSTTFKPGKSYSFTVPVDGYDYNGWDKAFKGEGEFNFLPIVLGRITRNGDSVYTIIDGQITFGAFRIDTSGYSGTVYYYAGHNEDRVCFCFTAENSDGDVLTVEDGYVNKQTNKYFVEYPVE